MIIIHKIRSATSEIRWKSEVLIRILSKTTRRENEGWNPIILRTSVLMPSWWTLCANTRITTKRGEQSRTGFAPLLLSIVSPIASVYGDNKDPSTMFRRSFGGLHIKKNVPFLLKRHALLFRRSTSIELPPLCGQDNYRSWLNRYPRREPGSATVHIHPVWRRVHVR